MPGPFGGVGYLPLLATKPAEMNALEQLPNKTKDAILPFFFFGRWVGSHDISNSEQRVLESYGERRHVLEVAPHQPFKGERKPVHDQLDSLRNHAGGYSNWVEFVKTRKNVVPAVQIAKIDQLSAQIQSLESLNRGIVLRLPPPTFSFLGGILDTVVSSIKDSGNCLILLDFETENQLLLNKQAEAVSYISVVQERLPAASIAISATSFPSSFGGLSEQDIFERQFFNGVRPKIKNTQLIFSDRGSARAKDLGGGGSEIPPRIDYPVQEKWGFYRATSAADKAQGYKSQAAAVRKSGNWDPKLRIWGTQQIEKTDAGLEGGISSQASAAAARINLHLHRQAHYDNPANLYDTEDDWED